VTATLAELQGELASGALTSVALVDRILDRIAATEPQLNAYVTVNATGARQAAQALDALRGAGHTVGPLHGIPISVKDLLDTHDLPTSAGGIPRSDVPPARDATVVAKLRGAGAIIIGKTNTHEFAYGYTTENPHHGDTHNPWDPARMAGGSSGGSAASVAAGSAVAAIGSDTGGSIRVPASLCGIVGIKPTFGRVSRAGVFPLAYSLDHVGPLTRSARDAAILLSVIAGPDPLDAATRQTPGVPDYAGLLGGDIAGLRVGVPDNYFFDHLDPEVASAVRAAADQLADLGAVLSEVTIPGLDAAVGSWLAIILAEATSIHEDMLRTHPEDYGEDVRGFIEAGALVPAITYLRAQRVRQALIETFAGAMANLDVLLTPSTALTAPELGTSEVTVGGLTEPLFRTFARTSSPFDITGLPTVSVPCGYSARGLPIGLQLSGHPFDEATVLRAAHHYQVATDTAREPPELSS
jgi:aspartyl-tRNA(Asn)/glutamyl-tRNA(Gln) amidotransferase subunit A